ADQRQHREHWRSANRRPPRGAWIVMTDPPATEWCSSTRRCSRRLLREPHPPALLLNWSGSPQALTVPSKRVDAVRAGGREPACSPRRYRPLGRSLFACGVACWPLSSSSGSASPIAMLAPPQARHFEPGAVAPQEGPSTRTAMLPVPVKSSRNYGWTTFFLQRSVLEH